MVFYCCIPSCKNTNKQQKMHMFPKDEKMYELWLKQVKNHKLFLLKHGDVRNNYRVCDVHFSEEEKIIGRRGANLKINSIPSLKIPPPREVIEQQLLTPEAGTGGCISNLIMEIDQPSSSRINFTMEQEQTPSESEELTISVANNSVTDRLTVGEDRSSVSSNICIERSTPIHFGNCVSYKDLSKRSNILHSLGVTTSIQLTPKAKKLHKMVSGLRKTAKRLFVERANLKKRLKKAEEILTSSDFLSLRLNAVTHKFFKMQLRLQKVSPRGRRFSDDDKLLALTLMKNSPKGYRLLCNYFALPTIRTLSNLLKKIPINSGINKTVMSSLKVQVEKLKMEDRYCTIIFDEIALEPSLVYSKSKDVIIGFQDNGSNDRAPIFADKAMVFMARGIHKKWKQPLCYFFNGGGMKADYISKYIKLVIQESKSVGLKVIGIVCDQSSANMKAINMLHEETRQYCILNGKANEYFGFVVDGEEVIPFFDPPHLLKGIRNNLFANNCRFTWRNNKTEIASWEDIKRLYELEEDKDEYRMCNKLTDVHIKNLKKMKVSVAAQVLSQRVAALMRGLARLGSQHMPPRAAETAEFLLFMDQVFDSVNGAVLQDRSGKDLRRAVTENSKHKEFWKDAIRVFQSMEFFNSKRNKIVPPTIKNWCHTLQAFLYVWERLRNAGFKFLCPRNINQDPVENFFGRIRSHGSRNVYPSCYFFIASFKSLIVGSVASVSCNSNCEDDTTRILHPLKEFLSAEDVHEPILLEDISEETVTPDNLNFSFLKTSTLTYIAGYLARKVFKKVKSCNTCKFDLIGDINQLSAEEAFIIKSRSFRPNALLSGTTTFNKLFRKCIYVLNNTLPRICYKSNISSTLKFILLSNINNETLSCKKHDTLDLFITCLIEFHLYTWCKNINKILKGKIHNNHSKDPIKLLAHRQFLKYKKYSQKLRHTEHS